MSVARIKKNDTVIAIAGESAGKTGKVLRVLPKKGKAVVQGLNMVKKAIRRSQTPKAVSLRGPDRPFQSDALRSRREKGRPHPPRPRGRQGGA